MKNTDRATRNTCRHFDFVHEMGMRMQMQMQMKMKATVRSARKHDGSVLLLMIAVTSFLALAILLFVLGFTRQIGSHHEQVKAIEAAALAAARSMSEVVIEDQNFGLIALTDWAPQGAQTTATDGFGTPVKGINTLLGTARIDMIIADQLDDATFRALSKRDYDNVMLAKDALTVELQRLTNSGQAGKDKDGKSISPYQDAVDAYATNQIRITGEATTLVPGSLKLTLGCIEDLPTNTDVPRPYKFAAINQNAQYNGKYVAYRDVPYNNRSFVFAGIGPSTALVDHKSFKTSVTSAPYVIPAIVKCEADQRFTENNLSGGPAKQRTLHAVACAQPGAREDRSPFFGGLVFIFDAGNVQELPTPATIMFNNQFNTSPVDFLQTVKGGDFPNTPLTTFNHPVSTRKNPMMSEVVMLALYDWVRRAGTRVDIESLGNMFTTNFAAANNFDLHSFQWTPAGTVDYKVLPGNSKIFLPVSENQWSAVSGLAFGSGLPGKPSYRVFDAYVTDYVYQAGRQLGGRHAGEPLAVQGLFTGTATPSGTAATNSLYALKMYATFPNGPGGGAIRDSYKGNNIAVAIRLHYRN